MRERADAVVLAVLQLIGEPTSLLHRWAFNSALEAFFVLLVNPSHQAKATHEHAPSVRLAGKSCCNRALIEA